MKRLGLWAGVVLVLLVAGALVFSGSVLGRATVERETPFLIPAGSSLSSVADNLEEAGLITSADGFLLSARLFGDYTLDPNSVYMHRAL